MLFRERHALGIHANGDGIQVVWLVATPGQTPHCAGSWHLPGDTHTLDASVLGHDAAWPRTCPMAVVLDDTQATRIDVPLAPGLSRRDRRFQQMTEVQLQFPHLGDDVVCDEDAQGRVCAVSHATLRQWQQTAKAWNARLQWLGLGDALDDQPWHPLSNGATDWRWAQAAQQSPWALRAALTLMAVPHFQVSCRPNWALQPGQLFFHEAVGRSRAVADHFGLTRRNFAYGTCAGMFCTLITLYALQALGDARDALTHTDATITQLQSQQQVLLRARADQQAAQQVKRQQEAQRDQVLQTLHVQAQNHTQWMQTLMQAQGVWLQRVTLHRSGSQMHWQLQGEALSPAHAQALQQALHALPGWHKPPSQTLGQWLHGQDRRFSVWSFEMQASMDHPW